MKEWHTIFIERVHLLVPTLLRTEIRRTRVGDIVLFVFSEGSSKRTSVWKLGRVEELISDTTILIQYSHAGIAPKTILCSVRSMVLLLGAEEIALDQE